MKIDLTSIVNRVKSDPNSILLVVNAVIAAGIALSIILRPREEPVKAVKPPPQKLTLPPVTLTSDETDPRLKWNGQVRTIPEMSRYMYP